MELSARDVVARAINAEVGAGRGSPHGGAFLDISHKPADYIRRKLPSMHEQFLKLAHVDITKQPMEVAPTIHYWMGGVSVDPETGASSLRGLFAAGEVASGLHGANRLGGNSLTDLLVFGKRAGEAAAEAAGRARKRALPPALVEEAIADLHAPLTRPGGPSPYQLQSELQDIVTRYAPIIREESGLKEGLEKVLALRDRAREVGTGGPTGKAFNPGWHTAIDLGSMLVMAEALFRGALARRESRGAHARSDYPGLDPALEKVNFTVHKTPEGMEVKAARREPIPELLLEAINRSYARYTPHDIE
jgi:succinate dehydrogenase / fumarate reductase flavoprotein subunit